MGGAGGGQECYKCGKRGYGGGYGGGGAGGYGGPRQTTCYSCGGFGHMSRDCTQGQKCYNCPSFQRRLPGLDLILNTTITLFNHAGSGASLVWHEPMIHGPSAFTIFLHLYMFSVCGWLPSFDPYEKASSPAIIGLGSWLAGPTVKRTVTEKSRIRKILRGGRWGRGFFGAEQWERCLFWILKSTGGRRTSRSSFLLPQDF
ncbi:hypothetical protein BU26DRAFT_267380 [Trematosphaeria pertusa]|uniref:CCHC-type domain-containing protein n=1 Tax=Trematosphaeria pertusa TaxID=390896 RepID=A0A6A6IJS3_9PLEO|nr:uncharacterized protein BU26DRAFT_267380 [Trematosphaeria pertusa]KAF2250626.1 hypothetical protein BU26DRAFT_267380 [Trematosphaeria pertusa]